MSIEFSSLKQPGVIRSLFRLGQRARLRLWWRDYDRLRIENLDGTPIIVLRGVFNGVLIRTGSFLAQALNSQFVSKGTQVLDLGTGSGIGAVVAARLGAEVTATDINPEAVRCAQINALALHLEQKIQTRTGDLFDPVLDQKFDLILFNPPYFRGIPRGVTDYAWRSPDVFDRFLRDLPLHLTDKGRALIVLSSDGDIAGTLESAAHLKTRIVLRRDFINEILTVYELAPFEPTTI